MQALLIGFKKKILLYNLSHISIKYILKLLVFFFKKKIGFWNYSFLLMKYSSTSKYIIECVSVFIDIYVENTVNTVTN